MALYFTLNEDTGDLEWVSHNPKPDVTTAEASVVAAVQTAAALRYIGQALYEVAEAIREAKRAS